MMKSFRIAVAGASLAFAVNANALPFTGLTVFGDSLSDSGNAYLALSASLPPDQAITEAPFPIIPSKPYARPAPLLPALSNGPIWAEVVGAALGLPVVPSLAGGKNFAFAAADSGPLPLVPPSQSPTLTQQFSMFSGAAPVVPSELYAVWGGGNDIRSALGVYQAVLALGGPDPQAAALAAATQVITAGVANIAAILAALAASGAQHILSLNVPDVGNIPALSPAPPISAPIGLAGLATSLSAAFNGGLAIAIDGIESTFSLDIVEVDVFSLVQSIVGNPGAFGLTNVTAPCNLGFDTCADPNQFLFLDGLHPTAAGHGIIASAALIALPAPGTSGLIFVGALALILGSRRSKTCQSRSVA
jgi:outer membrane lipase/esterase